MFAIQNLDLKQTRLFGHNFQTRCHMWQTVLFCDIIFFVPDNNLWQDLGTETMFKFAFSSKINPAKTGPYRLIGKLLFHNFRSSVIAQSDRGFFHYRRTAPQAPPVNLVVIFRCSSTTANPVCERRVNLLVYSLSLHRHSSIGFTLSFASSIHNKQLL